MAGGSTAGGVGGSVVVEGSVGVAAALRVGVEAVGGSLFHLRLGWGEARRGEAFLRLGLVTAGGGGNGGGTLEFRTVSQRVQCSPAPEESSPMPHQA